MAERFIRILKEQLLWVRTFRTVEEVRVALHEWLELYNEQWLIGRHGHRPPARREMECAFVSYPFSKREPLSELVDIPKSSQPQRLFSLDKVYKRSTMFDFGKEVSSVPKPYRILHT